MLEKPILSVPVYLLFGFLGVGKTTAIKQLLLQRPKHERWAILVNEFGEIGVDGLALQDDQIAVQQIPGGCMCCATGPVTQVTLNTLLRRERPDRLLIEPSGLAHPDTLLALLRAPEYRGVLNLCTPVTMVDPRQVVEARYQTHALFQKQIAVAGRVLVNKADLTDDVTLKSAIKWLHAHVGAGVHVQTIMQGALNLADFGMPESSEFTAEETTKITGRTLTLPEPLLDWRSQPATPTYDQWVMAQRAADGYFSMGWRMPASVPWAIEPLLEWLAATRVLRIKAVLPTAEGWVWCNVVEGAVSVHSTAAQQEAVLELIANHPLDAERLEEELREVLVVKY